MLITFQHGNFQDLSIFTGMKELLITLIVNAALILVFSKILPGIQVKSFTIAFVVAILMALLNTIVKPILIFLTLPVTLITLGLFILVINAFLIWLAGQIINDFKVNGFWPALFMGIFISLANWILGLSLTL
ncbi:MAG: phage holin family protein [Flavobacteriales bacterium]|nr:phage holin family protein [Flavobacteriales bacterium]